MIKTIATDILNKLNMSTLSCGFERFIGMGAHIEKMRPLLSMDSDEVRMIGIWGPPGIGKSTIARFLFQKLSNSFQLRAIMETIKVNYPHPCLDEHKTQKQLQSQMLSQMLDHKDMVIPHLGVAKERLKDKKVLLILDDVDRVAQLDALAQNIQWFGRGSRIIIATEDLRVLTAHGIDHIYTVDLPSDDEALQTFCMYAFGQNYPKDGFRKLSWQVVCHVGKLPLGLKVMGSYFRKMTNKQEWKKALPKVWRILDGEIGSVLEFSYDALDVEEKALFLHIACFFVGENIERVEEYLAKRFRCVSPMLDDLAKKSLISINNHKVWMHGLLVQLGREIVRKESPGEPGKRQFLVDSGDISEILAGDATGSEKIIGINFDSNGSELDINERAFEGMSNLNFLKMKGNTLHLPHGLRYLSPKLRLLHWKYFPTTCLPSNVNLKFLVELNMMYSKLEKLWEGIKPLPNLKWMYLRDSIYLKELPDLSTATNLQKLDLSGCSNLVELPSSFGNFLMNISDLDFRGCLSLSQIPSSIGNAINLRRLNFSGCSSLVELPASIGNLHRLEYLNMMGCSKLEVLPVNVDLKSLNILDLCDCSSLKRFPEISTNIRNLNLSGCSSLVELPSSVGNFIMNLHDLNFEGCSSLWLIPSSFGNAINLRRLNFSGCTSLMELPTSFGNLHKLEYLEMMGCSKLEVLPVNVDLKSLDMLDLCGCSSLKRFPDISTNIRDLNLSGCSSLWLIPSSFGNAINLRTLDFSGCTSLMELPTSFGNLHKLEDLNMMGCSKLEALPVNVDLKSLKSLYLSDCSSLKSFPEISTNIRSLYLNRTAIEEVPSTIRSWPHLEEFYMIHCKNLKKFAHGLDSSTERDIKIQEVSPLDQGRPHPGLRLIIFGCKKLLSLSQLPDSLSEVDARYCDSLERLDCCFRNPYIEFNFANCFKLNKEARDLIIQTPIQYYTLTVLPGKEIPTYFTYRSNADSLIVNLKEKPFPSSLIFEVCILLVSKNDVEDSGEEQSSLEIPLRRLEPREYNQDDPNGDTMYVKCWFMDKLPRSSGVHKIYRPSTEHLYIFRLEEVDVSDVSSNELSFDFRLGNLNGTKTFDDKWVIKSCGVHYGNFEAGEVNEGCSVDEKE